MIHAVNASVLSEIPVRRDKTDKANSENMITERTTEGERPVKKANPHNAVLSLPHEKVSHQKHSLAATSEKTEASYTETRYEVRKVPVHDWLPIQSKFPEYLRSTPPYNLP